MKTATTDLLNKELMILEIPIGGAYSKDLHAIIAYGVMHDIADGYTLLGKPDEIKEEDVSGLVEKLMNNQQFQNYKGRKEKDFTNLWCRTATESLLSAIESVVYWDVNPIKVHTWASENADIYHKKWKEAQEKTFDKNRSLIFVKI